jgi:hypothetical protein
MGKSRSANKTIWNRLTLKTKHLEWLTLNSRTSSDIILTQKTGPFGKRLSMSRIVTTGPPTKDNHLGEAHSANRTV